jgi:hypothetical protein
MFFLDLLQKLASGNLWTFMIDAMLASCTELVIDAMFASCTEQLSFSCTYVAR